MLGRKPLVFWFVVGSQHLYGKEAIAQVTEHAIKMATVISEDGRLPYSFVLKAVVTTQEEIRQVCLEANSDSNCGGIITWMHTFSPAKMWIMGLSQLTKPLLHLHTQYNRDIPWASIDMDFMNLNQSAHGDREFGFVSARLGLSRKVIAGHWQTPSVYRRIGEWMNVAAALNEGMHVKIARFGDNMRNVAVTEGDKVEAQVRFGWSVDGYGVGDLAERVSGVSDADVNHLVDLYHSLYDFPAAADSAYVLSSVREQARIELGLREFLEEGGFNALTTTFEDLHGLVQLPGLAIQRLMADGYGFGAEGDWKTAGLLRTIKVMGEMEGTSFMEDYTYHFHPHEELVLGSHMLEVCPTIAGSRPTVQVHPLGIGGKADPARLVFDGRQGQAVVASLIDLGNRFRLIVNEVHAIEPTHDMPKLPVARVLWRPEPSLETSTEAWIYAGGAHHTVFSYNITSEQLYDWASALDVEYVLINHDTSLLNFRRMLNISDAAAQLK